MINRTKTFKALPESVRSARQFTSQALADSGFAGIDTAVLLVSELVSNSVEHSLSAHSGGQVTVTVTIESGQHVRLAVADAGPVDGMAPLVPASCPPADDEGGRGLFIVTQLAQRWGYDHGQFWARLPWHAVGTVPAPAADPGALFAMQGGVPC